MICGDFTRISDYLTITDEDFVVIMTSGHVRDFQVEEQTLRGPFAYVGVIGSRRKTASVNQRLLEAASTSPPSTWCTPPSAPPSWR